MTTAIHLHGELAEAVGRARWDLAVSTPAEAMRAIEANTDGKLVDFFLKNSENEFCFVIDGEGVQHIDEVALIQRPMKELHVMPVMRGQGNNTGSILAIIGIVIVIAVISIVTFGIGGAAAAGAASSTGASTSLFGASLTSLTGTGSFLLTTGIALTFAGLSAMLAPTNSTDDVERPENKPSYLFNGTVNTYRQGNPVPIGFGVFRVGSQVISAGIKSADIIDE